MSDEKSIYGGDEADNGRTMITGGAQLSSNMVKHFNGHTGVEICLAVCMINKFLLERDPETLRLAAEVVGVQIVEAGVTNE